MRWYRCTISIAADSFQSALHQAEGMVEEKSFLRDGSNVHKDCRTVRLDAVYRTDDCFEPEKMP